jgi:carbohydrate ABC transporter membrane protein 1, CUT1 family (TC 3.A.1.1.-)
MLAFAALIMATVGIKPQLFQNLQFLILLVSLLLVIWIGFKAGKFEIITNRLRIRAMGWLIAATFSAALWSFAQKSTQLLFPALKEFRKIWNTFEPFALFATVVCILFALLLFIVGSRDSKLERPGFIERSLVNNLSSKIAALPMVLTAVGVFVIATLWTVYHSFTNSRMLPKSEFIGLAQYERLWSSDRWYMSIENLAIYGICSLIFSLIYWLYVGGLYGSETRLRIP